jgi:excisionase family DNA binding protein
VAEQSPPRAYFTVEQLAKRWQVSQRTIRRMIERGGLRAVRIGAQLRVADDVLQRFEERHATGSGR